MAKDLVNFIRVSTTFQQSKVKIYIMLQSVTILFSISLSLARYYWVLYLLKSADTCYQKVIVNYEQSGDLYISMLMSKDVFL